MTSHTDTCWRCGDPHARQCIQKWNGKVGVRAICSNYPRCQPVLFLEDPALCPDQPPHRILFNGKVICDICTTQFGRIFAVLFSDTTAPVFYCERCIGELAHHKVMQNVKIFSLGHPFSLNAFKNDRVKIEVSTV